MTTVYTVSRGSYSDYNVLAVFSDKGKAEAAQKLIDLDNDVEEIQLDPPTAPWLPPGHSMWQVFTKGKDPTNAVFARDTTLGAYLFDEGPPATINAIYSNPNPRSSLDTRFSTRVLARDADHAIKIASELFAQQAAREAGIAL